MRSAVHPCYALLSHIPDETDYLSAVYPLDTVKTRLQARPSTSVGTSSAQPNIAPGSLDKDGSASSSDGKSTTAARPTNRAGSQGSHSASPIVIVRALIKRLKRWEMLAMLVKIVRTEGVTGAFKGFSANMINTFSQREYLALIVS